MTMESPPLNVSLADHMGTGGWAIVLLAHGSRDPLWHAPIRAVADRIQARSNGGTVVCAYLEWTSPDLPTAVQQLVDAGHRQVRLLPLFLGMGKHAREDLPGLVAELRKQHPQLILEVLPSAGEHPLLLDLLADMALKSP